MEKEILISQGAYRVGRDIPAGVYVITAVNDYGCVIISDDHSDIGYYTLDDEHGKSCHFEVNKGDVLNIDGKTRIRRITRFLSDSE